MASLYEQQIKERSIFRYYIGLLARWFFYRKYHRSVVKARKNKSIIGEGVCIPKGLARIANKNLLIGNHVSIQTSDIDLRSLVKIGNHVIIGSDVKILTASHNIDSEEWDFKTYGIEIEDYSWIATGATIMPSCRKIGYGAVVGAGSVVVKDVEPMSVISGNPAKEIRKRKCVHTNLVVESLLGGDFEEYRKTWNKKL